MKSNAMTAHSKFLILLAIFLIVSNANAFTSLSPVAGHQVQVNNSIRFQQPMSNPTNEPSREPIREPTNDRKNSEPIVSYSQIKRDKSTPTFRLVVALVSNNNALSFYDKSSSKFQLVVASVANECSKGSSMKTAQRAICSKCKSFQDNVSIDSWQCRMEIDKVISMKTAQCAIGSKCKSFQSRGHCYDKKSERVGNCASTQQDFTFQLIVGFKQFNQSSTRKSWQCRSFVDNLLINLW